MKRWAAERYNTYSKKRPYGVYSKATLDGLFKPTKTSPVPSVSTESSDTGWTASTAGTVTGDQWQTTGTTATSSQGYTWVHLTGSSSNVVRNESSTLPTGTATSPKNDSTNLSPIELPRRHQASRQYEATRFSPEQVQHPGNFTKEGKQSQADLLDFSFESPEAPTSRLQPLNSTLLDKCARNVQDDTQAKIMQDEISSIRYSIPGAATQPASIPEDDKEEVHVDHGDAVRAASSAELLDQEEDVEDLSENWESLARHRRSAAETTPEKQKNLVSCKIQTPKKIGKTYSPLWKSGRPTQSSSKKTCRGGKSQARVQLPLNSTFTEPAGDLVDIQDYITADFSSVNFPQTTEISSSICANVTLRKKSKEKTTTQVDTSANSPRIIETSSLHLNVTLRKKRKKQTSTPVDTMTSDEIPLTLGAGISSVRADSGSSSTDLFPIHWTRDEVNSDEIHVTLPSDSPSPPAKRQGKRQRDDAMTYPLCCLIAVDDGIPYPEPPVIRSDILTVI